MVTVYVIVSQNPETLDFGIESVHTTEHGASIALDDLQAAHPFTTYTIVPADLTR